MANEKAPSAAFQRVIGGMYKGRRQRLWAARVKLTLSVLTAIGVIGFLFALSLNHDAACRRQFGEEWQRSPSQVEPNLCVGPEGDIKRHQ